MKTQIIVVGYGLPEMESQCLKSVLNHTSVPFTLTYTDNKKNKLTLTQVWNKLIRKSEADYICLLNSDTQVTSGWLELMLEAFDKFKDCGFVGPSTNNCHSPQKKIPTPEEAKKRSGKYKKMTDPISGFCLVFERQLWHALNKFDERYTFYGQESDFIDRSRTALGLNCYWSQGSFVWHEGEASVRVSGMDVEKERMKAKQLYHSERR